MREHIAATPAARDGAPGVSTAAAVLQPLAAGRFLMGSDDAESIRGDGEGPVRQVTLRPFRIGATAVTNRQFGDFVRDTGYMTQAERLGSSFVFRLQVAAAMLQSGAAAPTALPWWLEVRDACWQRPEGPGTHIHQRPDHPVVHVSWDDAQAYCDWAGLRLPTEAEWEYAARGGLEQAKYPWGDELEAGGRLHCNIWQGGFPDAPRAGWRPGTMAAASFEPNGHGLYNVSGNVWEWCADWFTPLYHTLGPSDNPCHLEPTGRRSMRGGSFLCHASYCNRYRVAARNSNTPASTASNCGFRVAADAA